MKPPPTTTRWALVLCALVPVLLSGGVETLRVCLHDWLDIRDGCQEALVVEVAPEGCCSDEGRPEGPAVGVAHDCDGCCIEIACERDGVSATPASAEGLALDLALPAVSVGELVVMRPARQPPRCDTAPPRSPPGRAPTPLRI